METTRSWRATPGEREHADCRSACSNSPRAALVSLRQWALEASRSWQMTPLETEWAVFLHVYDFSPVTSFLGLPVFHIAVEVCDSEVAFGQSGIQVYYPGLYYPQMHLHTLLLGHTTLTAVDIAGLLNDLEKTWQGKDYQLIGKNCQGFAVDFIQRLGLASSAIPIKYRAFAGLDLSLCCAPAAEERSQQRRGLVGL